MTLATVFLLFLSSHSYQSSRALQRTSDHLTSLSVDNVFFSCPDFISFRCSSTNLSFSLTSLWPTIVLSCSTALVVSPVVLRLYWIGEPFENYPLIVSFLENYPSNKRLSESVATSCSHAWSLRCRLQSVGSTAEQQSVKWRCLASFPYIDAWSSTESVSTPVESCPYFNTAVLALSKLFNHLDKYLPSQSVFQHFNQIFPVFSRVDLVM